MSSRIYQTNTFSLLLIVIMEKTLEQLQAEFMQTFEKEVPVNKKNDAEWIASKIAEAKKAEEENQTTNPDDNSDEPVSDDNSDDDTESEDGFEEDENRFNTEEDNQDEESDTVADNEDYDDNSVDNQVMTQEARKVGDIVYPV